MVVPRGLIAGLLAAALSGCSIVMTKGAPDHVAPTPTPPDCTTSKVAVYLDGAISGAAVGTSLFIGLAALASSERRTELGYATLFTFLGSIPFMISSIVGGVRVNSCRKAHEQYRMMMAPQPHPYGPYQQPYGPPGAPPPPPM